jgi:glutathione S-transferase
MANYRLHCFGLSGNAYKVALYLNCAGLTWEPVEVKFLAGETRDPDWRQRVNATQSGAILTYLAETTGKFALKSADDRYEALRWVLFDNHKFTSYFATHRFLYSISPQAPDPAVLAFLRGRAEAALGIVDKHLADLAFMLGAAPTIADFSLIGYMYYPKEETGFDLPAQYPNIAAWTDRMKALPGWKHPYDLMPGGSVPLRKAAS